MTTIIDESKMAELLDKAVEARGADFNYRKHFGITEADGCAYRHGLGPGCIIGWVIFHLNLEGYICEGVSANELLTRISSRPDNDYVFDLNARRLATTAQYNQDQGSDWGPAVAGAKRGARLLIPRYA